MTALVKRLHWPLLILAVLLYLYFPVMTLWQQGLSSNDFKHIYLGMKAILDGISPYPIKSLHHQAALQGYKSVSVNPYVYLPFTGHSMAFLAPFSLEQAVKIWFVLNHLFALASVAIISQLFAPRRIGAASALLLSLAFSAPFYRTLSAGQLNMALLFLISLGWYTLRRGKLRWCGFLIGFAMLFKLMPGLYGLYFLLRHKWTAFAAMAVTSAVLLVASVLAIGPGIYLEFIPVLRQMSYGKSTWPHVFSFWDDPANQSLNSFFSHILTLSDHTSPWARSTQGTANALTIAVTLALLTSYVITILKRRPILPGHIADTADEAAWCSTLILALLIPSLLWDHYLVMLILPTAWMIWAACLMKRFAVAAVVAILYFLTCLPWNFEAEGWRTGFGIVLMSFKLWPTLALFGLSLCFTRFSVEIVPSANVTRPAEQ